MSGKRRRIGRIDNSPAVLAKKKKAVMDMRLFNDESFVRAQYIFVQEGQLRKQKCIYCAAYFKDSMFTLQTHIRDKCSSRPAVIKRTKSGRNKGPVKEKKMNADEQLKKKLSTRDNGLLEKEAFLLAQFLLFQEGQHKKYRCRYCAAYFKNSITTLHIHLRDKCPEFAKRMLSRLEVAGGGDVVFERHLNFMF